jgi:hypothetical protein
MRKVEVHNIKSKEVLKVIYKEMTNGTEIWVECEE